MASLKRKNTLYVSPALVEQFDKLQLNKSKAIALAIRKAIDDPVLLARAFQLRLSLPPEENSQKISYTVETKVDESLRQLSQRTGLHGEQVVRLSMEAYIHRL